MDTTLVVVRAFGTRAVGDVVTSPEDTAALLAGEHAGHVVSVVMPKTTAPQKGS